MVLAGENALYTRRSRTVRKGFCGCKDHQCKGKLLVGFVQELDVQMIMGRDWPPLYEVLEEVQRDELRHKGRPRVEGWIAEREATSLGEDDWISLRTGARGHQFQTA